MKSPDLHRKSFMFQNALKSCCIGVVHNPSEKEIIQGLHATSERRLCLVSSEREVACKPSERARGSTDHIADCGQVPARMYSKNLDCAALLLRTPKLYPQKNAIGLKAIISIKQYTSALPVTLEV